MSAADDTMWLGRTDADWADVEPVDVPLEGIGFVQSHVSVGGLLKHAAADGQRGHEPGDEYPRFVDVNGQVWVVDGAHRTAVSVIRGEQTIRARLRRWPW